MSQRKLGRKRMEEQVGIERMKRGKLTRCPFSPSFSLDNRKHKQPFVGQEMRLFVFVHQLQVKKDRFLRGMPTRLQGYEREAD